IHRIDPATGQTIATIPVEGIASWEVGGGGIDVEPGAVWVAGDVCGPGGGGAILQRIDPATNEAEVVADLGAGFAADVDATPEAVWVSVFRDRSEAELLRVDPETGAIEATIPTGSQYTREVLEAHGAVWIHPRIVEASTVGSGYLVKIDPRTGEVAGRLDVNMEAPAAWDGSLWAHHGDTIIRIDPARVTVEQRYEEAGSSAYGFLRSGAGGLWFIHTRDAPGVGAAPVVRFNPATASIDVVADLGPDLIPIDLAVTESAIWVVNYGRSLTHVELRSP
ncbi:MAG TPA: hypothetical protein VJ868_10265, partial [Actinomycetota bacterium]|nr:hypothetical protein [Actinomycetota bacterium]